ncbi:MAG: thiamine-phosphate synthase family protein [Thermoprotei archaeon]
MVKKFLPPMRGLVAHSLNERGESQEDIAKALGVTQAAVSQYLSRARTQYVSRLLEFGLKSAEIDEMVSELSTASKHSDESSTELLYAYWKAVASSGSACSVHRIMSGGLTACDLCIRTMSSAGLGREKREAVFAVRDAVTLLESSPAFAKFVPEVYSNIVYSLPNPASEQDVVGVPGRLVKVRGRVKALLPPEFGVSGHMARVLLSARARNPWVRSVLNVKMDQPLVSALKRVGGVHVVLSKGGGVEGELLRELAELGLNAPAAALVYPGTQGVESMVYLFGKDPLTVAEIAVSACTMALIPQGESVV